MTTETTPTEAPPARPGIPAATDSAVAPTSFEQRPTVTDGVVGEKPVKAVAKKAAGKKARTLELTLTVTGTADGEWRAELKHGTAFLARNVAVAAAAVSRAARELHEDLSIPLDAVIEEARAQQAARVAALEAELEAARRALADLD